MTFPVGTVVRLKSPLLKNQAGVLGVVFYDYGDGSQVIFENGELDGFSLDEQNEYLAKIGTSPLLEGYQFQSVMKVDWDFHSGVFDSVLKSKI
jgi:hypothetical protein